MSETTNLSTYESDDEKLIHEMFDEAIFQGKKPQWGHEPIRKKWWIEIDGNEAEMAKIRKAAKKIVDRARTIASARAAMMDTGR